VTISIRTKSANGRQSYEQYDSDDLSRKMLATVLDAHRAGGMAIAVQGDAYVVTDKVGAFVQRVEISQDN
jgi:hypothetical protein